MRPNEDFPPFWIATRARLVELSNQDRNLQGVKLTEPQLTVARLFCDYSRTVHHLDQCWNRMCQAQKNMDLSKLLNAAVVRLMELRDIFTQLDISEFHYVDGVLIELKIVPHDAEILTYAAYPLPRSQELQQVIENALNPPPEPTEEPEEDELEKKRKFFIKEEPPDPLIEIRAKAALMIQKHERARQGRLEYFDEKSTFDIRNGMKEPFKLNPDEQTEGAIVIQKYWRGRVDREINKKRESLRRLLICMDEPSWKSTEKQDNVKLYDLQKKQLREQRLREYIETVGREQARLLKMVKPGLMEDIGDEIREWFRVWYDVAKAFDKYPPEEKGGTIIVIRGETMTPEQYRELQEIKRREKEKMKNNPALAEKKKREALKAKMEAAKAKKEAKKKEKERKKLEKLMMKKKKDMPFTMEPSNGINIIKKAEDDYHEIWGADDGPEDPEHKPVMSMITDAECYKIQLEARKDVDVLMRLELELLVDALKRDRTGRKGKKKKDKKKKKKKKGKKRKGKKKKDPLAGMDITEIFQEFVDNGIIRKYERTELKEFVGDFSYRNFELRMREFDPLPCVGDVRQIIMNTCILPLGGQNIPKPKSVCIFGPRHSGKKLLVNAICSETDAILFDLTPSVLAGKYQGKKEMKRFLVILNGLARLFQPSVFFMDGAEKPFYKKVPKPERKNEPKRLKKALFKGIVKPILPEDRVMLISTSKEPWNCAKKKLVKAYERFIMVPRADYGTVLLVWRSLLMPIHGVDRSFDFSSLTLASVGYPVDYLRETAARVLNPARIVRLRYQPLRAAELLEALMTGTSPEPVTDQEQFKYTKWYNKSTALGKVRTKIMKVAAEKREQEARAAAKKAAKK